MARRDAPRLAARRHGGLAAFHTAGHDRQGDRRARPAVDVLAGLVAEGTLAPGRWLHLPRLGPGLLGRHLVVVRRGSGTSWGPPRPRPGSRSSRWSASPTPTTPHWAR
ncbi:hypothetical protein QTQ03_02380 [Micromonospora sp. WMMA1363]|uniref:hypothetical protein n=1 Tax=Micromonospora sp. WMMA1363 TaxID=3053985 RepID=UPI00259D25B8|nr:hypothetical protein [Micromonospora sp. WMMA1363]MDM4718496.1 hypothetical protein [Micromonospora sp. WMMA1363]